MTVSRRQFLEVAACALPAAFASGRWTGHSSGAPAAGAFCTLVDLGTDCALPESLQGFARGLAMAGVPSQSSPFERLTEWVATAASPLGGVVLVPGGVLRSPRVAAVFRAVADQGATVLYESGAAYAASEDFARERNLLRQHFGIRVDAPIDLWDPGIRADFAPYVHYAWPKRLIVRDFSRVIPVSKAHEILAKLGIPGCPNPEAGKLTDVAVAARVPLGVGEFVYLGSPLGPHVGSGDHQAQDLLKAFIRPESKSVRAATALQDRFWPVVS